MPESLRKGNNKKSAQKYQNTTKYRHNKNSKKTKVINSLPVCGLCQRCYDIIQWRKSFRKYKTLTQPKKCVNCLQKTIKDAYHILCAKCAESKGVCAKCQEKKEIIHEISENQQEMLIEELKGKISNLSIPERKKRAFFRKIDREGPEEFEDFDFAEKSHDFLDDDEFLSDDSIEN